MKLHSKLFLVIVVVGLIFLLYAGGGQEETDNREPITVASKIDTEGALLGQMIVHMLRDAGYEVIDKTEFGTTDVIRKAIKSGEIDIYPEYTGNGGYFFDSADSDVWHDPEEGYATVKEKDKEENNIVWLEPASANNTWAIATRKELADRENLTTLEDFAGYVNDGGRVKLAASEEFASRSDVLPAFEEAYGFNLERDQLLLLSGGNTAQTEKAASQGTDDVNFAMAYGTDGTLAALDLVVLEDTKGVQPIYQPTPIVRQKVLDTYPEIDDILNPVFKTLDLETLQNLNGMIVVQGRIASDVAREYLKQEGFLE
ncbi:MAG: ABC transporter substrate-binding protein [Spirochaetia bacterium]